MFIKIIFSVKLAGCSLHSDAGGWQISLCFSEFKKLYAFYVCFLYRCSIKHIYYYHHYY